MRSCVQRVSRAEVHVDGVSLGKIGNGLVALLGVGRDDDVADAEWMARKLVSLRVFDDDQGRMNRALNDVGGEILVVSQFTLLGDCRRGNRPSFTGAATPDQANKLYLLVCDLLRHSGAAVATGQFRAHMEVSLVNDGPVTLLLDSRGKF